MRRTEPMIPVEPTEIAAVLVLDVNPARDRRFRALLRLRAALRGGER